MSAIRPVVEIFPQQYSGGMTAVMMITVINPLTKVALLKGDWFHFELESPWGTTVRGQRLLIKSASGALQGKFSLTLGTDRRSLRVTYVATKGNFFPGEGFAVVFTFRAPAAYSFGIVTATSIMRLRVLEEVAPKITTVAFVQASTAPSSGTGGTIEAGDGSTVEAGDGSTVEAGDGSTVEAGDGSTVEAGDGSTVEASDGSTVEAGDGSTVEAGDGSTVEAGDGSTVEAGDGSTVEAGDGSTVEAGDGSTVEAGDGSTVEAGDGSTVEAGDGSTVNVGPGAVIHLPDGSIYGGVGASGPNFLQVAANRWYEGSDLPAISLGAIAGALAFDGRGVWVACAQTNTMTEIAVNSGLKLSPQLTGLQPRQLPDEVEAMIFDGQKFWISGPKGGVVVRPDGVIARQGIPACSRGSILFDGSSVWLGYGSTLKRIFATDYTETASLEVGGIIRGLATDGSHLWVASVKGGAGMIERVQLNSPAIEPSELGFLPTAIAWDGSHLWIGAMGGIGKYSCNLETNTYDEAYLYPALPGEPTALLFDGKNIWVAMETKGLVYKLRASSGDIAGMFPAGQSPGCMAFDGISVWIADKMQPLVRKL